MAETRPLVGLRTFPNLPGVWHPLQDYDRVYGMQAGQAEFNRVCAQIVVDEICWACMGDETGASNAIFGTGTNGASQ